MLISDMPNLPPQDVPVMIIKTIETDTVDLGNVLASPPTIISQVIDLSDNTGITLNYCQDVQTPDNPNGQLGGGFSPATALRSFWDHKFHEILPIREAKITVIEKPKFGVLIDGDQDVSSDLGPSYFYTPNNGFIGSDKATFLINVVGKSVKFVTTIIVVKHGSMDHAPCFKGVKQLSRTEIKTHG